MSHAAPPASRQWGLGRAQAPGEEPAEVTGALLADNVHDESSSGSQGMLKVRKEFKTGKKKLEVSGVSRTAATSTFCSPLPQGSVRRSKGAERRPRSRARPCPAHSGFFGPRKP